MEDFKERFGLDYLKKARAAAQQQRVESTEAPSGLEDALITYGRRVLEVLNAAPDNTSRVLDLAQQLRIRLDTIIPVVNHLESRGHVVRTAEDPVGNDTLKITEAGKKLLK